MRAKSNGRYWIDLLQKKMNSEENQDIDLAVITDIRYHEYDKDEVYWLKKELGGILLHLTRFYTEYNVSGIPLTKYLQPINDDEKKMTSVKIVSDLKLEIYDVGTEKSDIEEEVLEKVGEFMRWYENNRGGEWMEVSDTSLINNIKYGAKKPKNFNRKAFTSVHKYVPENMKAALNASGISIDDVIQEKEYLVYKSVMSYNPEKKVKFNTWLGNQVRYHCLNTINSNNNYIKVEDSVLDFLGSEEQKDFQNDVEYIFSLLHQLKMKE